MAWPGPAELRTCATLFGVCQAAASAGFLWRRWRESVSAPPSYAPAATLVVPCAGGVGGSEESLSAFLGQDYVGALEVLFVVPSERDPAFARISAFLAARPDPRARLLATGLVPSAAAGKPLDLAAACRAASPASAVLAFADSDIRPGRTWLSELVAPLGEPAVGVTTAMTPFVPADTPTGVLRLAWLAAGIPALELTRCPSGQSMALRRADFDALGLEGLWRSSLSEDMSLSRRVRFWPKAVRFVGRALPLSIDGMDEQGLVTVFNRWIALFRVYRPEVWALGATTTALKLFFLARAFAPKFDPALLALYAGAEAINMALCLAGFAACLPQRGRGLGAPALRAVAAAPLLPLLFAVNFLGTAVVRTVAWGRYVYRVRGPGDVTAHPAGAAPGFPWKAAAAAAAAGVLTGLAHLPGGWWTLSAVAYVPALWFCRRADRDDVLLLGWLWGLVAWLVGVPWLPSTLAGFLKVGPAEAWAFALLAYALFCFPVAVWAWAGREASEGFSRVLGPALGPPAAFVAAGLAVEGLNPGVFPSYVAHALTGHPPIVQAAAWTGVAGVSALVLLFNAGLYLALTGGSRAALAAAAGLMAAAELAGAARARSLDAELGRRAAAGEGLRVAALQAAMAPGESRRPDRRPAVLGRYNELTRRALASGGVDLVVWPESVYGRELRLSRGPGGEPVLSADGRPFDEVRREEIPFDVPLLLNTWARTGRREYNLSLTSGFAKTQVVVKRFLMPFGEYMPQGRRFPFLYRISPQTGRLSAGREQTVLDGPRGARLGVLICYEDKFSRFAAGYARAGAEVLVGMTDNAWFLSDLAHEQDLLVAAMRAVETRRYLVRAVSGGVSAVVSPTGRVLARVDSGVDGALVERVLAMPGPAPGPAVGAALYAAAAVLVAASVGWTALREARR